MQLVTCKHIPTCTHKHVQSLTQPQHVRVKMTIIPECVCTIYRHHLHPLLSTVNARTAQMVTHLYTQSSHSTQTNTPADRFSTHKPDKHILLSLTAFLLTYRPVHIHNQPYFNIVSALCSKLQAMMIHFYHSDRLHCSV